MSVKELPSNKGFKAESFSVCTCSDCLRFLGGWAATSAVLAGFGGGLFHSPKSERCIRHSQHQARGNARSLKGRVKF